MGAAVVDLALFTLVAWLVFTFFDRRTMDPRLYPPFQASAAWRWVGPSWLLVWTALFAVPTALTGQTLGKRLWGVRVVDAAGRPPGWLRALVRELPVKWVGLAANGAGWWVALLGPGRPLHDVVTGTTVVEDAEKPGEDDEWAPVSVPAVVALGVGVGLVVWSHATGGRLAWWLWNGAAYVPHEAGHLVAGFFFPHLVVVAAGTVGQLLFPALAMVGLVLRRSTLELAGVLVWLGFMLLDAARYAADAWDRSSPLPVAIGDELTEAHLDAHDWWQMLSAAGLLRYAQPVGQLIAVIAWLSFAVAFGLVVARLMAPRSSEPAGGELRAGAEALRR
ncbi:MAG: RDD family protein [Myxococcaceae bacterium]|nr:RDD family protein [Myxococcaceae bacterium]